MQTILLLLTVAALLLGACGGMHREIQAPEEETPPAPAAPVLSAGAATSTSATVTWTAPETELAIAGYELRWRRAGDTDWTGAADIASTSTSHTIDNLEAATAYEIQVRAKYADREGDWSPEVTVETAPPPPVLAPGATMPTAVTVTWTAPDTALVIAGYKLRWRRAGDTDWTGAADIASTSTSHTIDDLEAATAYEVQVRAWYADTEGEWSLIVTVETTAPPPPSTPAPRRPPRTPPIFTVTMVTATSITVQWTAADPAITHYDVRWRGFLVKGAYSQVRVPSTDPTYTIDLGRGCHCIVGSRAVTGEVEGPWFYLSADTKGPIRTYGPHISIITDDAVYDEGDGAVEFILTTQDRVSEALIVSVNVSDDGYMLKQPGRIEVRVGVGSTRVRFRVGLEVDTIDEPDSWISARVVTGRSGPHYEVGDVTTAFVRVRDDD